MQHMYAKYLPENHNIGLLFIYVNMFYRYFPTNKFITYRVQAFTLF